MPPDCPMTPSFDPRSSRTSNGGRCVPWTTPGLVRSSTIVNPRSGGAGTRRFPALTERNRLSKRKEIMNNHFDVVVIGAGPAGLTAALFLARSRCRVMVVDAGEPRNAPAEHMRGFLSGDGLSPRDFLARGRAEVEAYGATILSDWVVSVGSDRTVHLASGGSLQARRVLVASGVVDVLPPLPGFAERWGRDVFHCPYCHGYEVADRDFAVLATSQGAIPHALLLRQWSDRVTLITHTQSVSDE